MLLIFGLNFPVFAGSPFYYFDQREFFDVTRELKRPQWLAAYNQDNFEYASDFQEFEQFDYWQKPQEFFQRKKGDCEDYAFWSNHVLKAHGYNPAVVVVGEPVLDHALVKFSENGEEKYLDFFRILDRQSYPSSLPIERLDPQSYHLYSQRRDTAVNGRPVTSSSIFEHRLQTLDHPSTINLQGLNYLEVYLPLVNYPAARNKEAVAYGRKLSSDLSLFLNFAAFGWYSPSPQYNERLYGTTLAYRWAAISGYYGDYKGVDLDAAIPLNKFFSLTTAYRSGNIWDWQGNLTTNLFNLKFRYDDNKLCSGELSSRGIIISNQYLGLSNQFFTTYYNFSSRTLSFKMQF
ncbi:MAG: transglutaminase-like domain-containing protein [Elusimicrobiota bacterium]